MNRQLNPPADANAKFPVPIAIFGFNRPDLMVRQIDLLRSVRPARMLFVLDGPRAGKSGEAKLCDEVAASVKLVDWDCEIEVNRSEKNLGCRKRVSSGITWVFSRVERAIILEDDCSPHADFFRYAETLLGRYADDPRVLHISGFTPLSDSIDSDYAFCRFPMIWGWATWRRAWAEYDETLTKWATLRGQWKLFRALPLVGYLYWNRKFWRIRQGFDTWDYQWTFACLIAGGHCATPEKNLIANLGFRSDATHTVEETKVPEVSSARLTFPLREPPLKFNPEMNRSLLASMWWGFKRPLGRLLLGKGL